eukprot:Gb_08721 [translate_table: standard]
MSIMHHEISITEGNLIVRGKPTLSNVPTDILLTHISNHGCKEGAFLGGTSTQSKSRHVFNLGLLEGFKFFCCFRFRFWWMMHRMGNHGSEIPYETQILLLEGTQDFDSINQEGIKHEDSDESDKFYILFLPLLDGPFRSSLQGNQRNELELCVESDTTVQVNLYRDPPERSGVTSSQMTLECFTGIDDPEHWIMMYSSWDPDIQTTVATNAVFINAGESPFELIRESILLAHQDLFKPLLAMQKHMGTFKHRESKEVPGILDWFGWCTWDAFYRNLNAEGIDAGLRSLKGGGTPARFLLIDDGWQVIENEYLKENEPINEETLFACRLVDTKENKSFCKSQGDGNGLVNGLQDLVKWVKQEYQVKYVYIWHTIGGYWGGVQPWATKMIKYEPTIAYPVQSPGMLGNSRDKFVDRLGNYGFGLINPHKIGDFYNDLHSYLASAGVDGVKVDAQNILGSLGAGFGGQYRFNLQTAIARASEDFFPRNPLFHSIHVASVAYNSFLIGEVMQPDWDMFHSRHIAAEFHAAARAIGGCGVYVSDKPGEHDFSILKKLVLPDGSILRARLPGRPTRDCLFDDPTLDAKRYPPLLSQSFLLVLGIFNCQGAGWCKEEKKIKANQIVPGSLNGFIRPRDIELLHDVAGENWKGYSVIYAHRTGNLVLLTRNEALPLTLKVLEYEVYTITPIKELSSRLCFAPLGLIDMYNAGGAIQTLEYTSGCKLEDEDKVANSGDCWCVKMRVHGCGRFGAYSTVKPTKCCIDTIKVGCDFDYGCSLLTLSIPSRQGGGDCIITIFLASQTLGQL